MLGDHSFDMESFVFYYKTTKKGENPIVAGKRPNTLECVRNVKFCGRVPNHPRCSFATRENNTSPREMFSDSLYLCLVAIRSIWNPFVLYKNRKKKKKEGLVIICGFGMVCKNEYITAGSFKC